MTGRLNGYDLVLTQTEAAQFLIRSAAEYGITFCSKHGCPVCQDFVWTWQSVYGSLKAENRLAVDMAMDRSAIPFPTYETEED